MSREFTGDELGAGVSIILVDTRPGRGPKLHRHEYEEVFVLREGEVTFTIGDAERVARAGDTVFVPPDTPHAFFHTGDSPLGMVAIHASPRFVTEWLDQSS
jgi:mannose-6-phosphate isomerase-like protein (cupin superfamily)